MKRVARVLLLFLATFQAQSKSEIKEVCAVEFNTVLNDRDVDPNPDETIDSIAQDSLQMYQNILDDEDSDDTKVSALPAQLYAALYFYDPYEKPLTSFSSLRRLSKWSTDIEFEFNVAGNSYGSGGNRENLASYIFGKKDIKVQDLALVTRLAAKGGIIGALGLVANQDDFANIAQEPVEFDAFTHREQIQIGAGFALFEKKLRISAGMPVVMGTNRLRVINDGQLFKKVFERSAYILVGDFKNYSLSGFIDALVADMGMKPDAQSTQYGLGQAFVGAIYHLPVDRLEHAQIGLQVHFPTATKSDINRVWPVDLGVNNFALSANGMMLFNHNRYLNPYAHIDGRFNFSSKATRRVPRLVSKDAAAHPQEKMALGNWVTFIHGGDFNDEIEATVRGFSDFATDIKWRLGNGMFLQVGNIFKKVIGRGGFLDLAYCLRIKMRDFVASNGAYFTQPLIANTDETEHQIKLGYSYYFTDAFTLSIQSSGVFAGKNVAQDLSLKTILSFSF